LQTAGVKLLTAERNRSVPLQDMGRASAAALLLAAFSAISAVVAV
jgi:hypothetical protein